MAKEKEKIVTVNIADEGEEKNEVKITVKRPSSNVMSKAQRISAKVWTDCVRDGIMTKKELAKFMREQGIWNKDKDSDQEKITQEIVNLEKRLFIGKATQKNKLSATEAKEIAIDMRRKRAELRDLIGERLALEANTADSLSDNARFDFLVANCTYDSDGELVYKTLDDYNADSDSPIAFAAANALAQIMYSIDKDFESNLPENRFLKQYNFVNDDLALINESGETVDLEGRRVNELGQYIDDKGNRVDKDGNRLDADGNYIPKVKYFSDSGEELKPKSDSATATKAKPQKTTKAKQQTTEEVEETEEDTDS